MLSLACSSKQIQPVGIFCRFTGKCECIKLGEIIKKQDCYRVKFVFSCFDSVQTVFFACLWQDLQSTNLVEVCMALTVVSQIFPREMIPAVLPLIEDKLQHSK